MTSLLSYTKQIPLNGGYYINVGDCRTRFLQNNGTDALPSFGANVYATSTNATVVAGNTVTVISTLLASPGSAVFRDHGKTLVSAGRTFRKVQLMVSTNSVWPALGTDGVGGLDNAPVNYLTGYLELPGQGTGSGTGSSAPVARLG
jgi:hypothetical protein